MTGVLEGEKVCLPEALRKAEKKAIEAGASSEQFMEQAASGIADIVLRFSQEMERGVVLLAGKGNNGGDCFAAGRMLLERGVEVFALHIAPLEECSELCRIQYNRFVASGGKVQRVASADEFTIPPSKILLDGLVGSGFIGKAEGLLAATIEKANQSGAPIVAIDIPSGLDGATGDVPSVAIRALATVSLGLPKVGFFLKEGFEHVGELFSVPFGLDAKCVQEIAAEGFIISDAGLGAALPPIKRCRHKYQAGYLLAIGASLGMPGAALLSCLGALRSGAGIVRLFHPEGMEEVLSSAPLELIKEGWDLKDPKRILEEAKRAKAALIGPGMGRSKQVQHACLKLLKQLKIPTVIDADALYFLASEPGAEVPQEAVLTPHHEELRRFLSAKEDLWIGAQRIADQKQVTLVLKGAPTVIFHPLQAPLIIPYGDPGMATAGTGDVLTGVIAALLAQGLDARCAAALGSTLHALAGEAAASELGSYSMMATDLIRFLPDAFFEILEQRD